MTQEQEQMLIEVHEMLTFFKDVYDQELAGKEFSPNPTNTVTCPKKLE
jgi:hypothetical protein